MVIMHYFLCKSRYTVVMKYSTEVVKENSHYITLFNVELNQFL